jgi:hypothetical protein
VCVVLCNVFRLIVVLFCVMCVVRMLCLIVVPLSPGENPFAVKINNNNTDGLVAVRPAFDSRQFKIFLYSTASRSALGPSQPPVQWAPQAISSGGKAERA